MSSYIALRTVHTQWGWMSQWDDRMKEKEKEKKRERKWDRVIEWLTAKLDRSDTKKDVISCTSSQNEKRKAKECKGGKVKKVIE